MLVIFKNDNKRTTNKFTTLKILVLREKWLNNLPSLNNQILGLSASHITEQN